MLTCRDIEECLVRAEIDTDDKIQSAMEDFFRPDIEQEAAMMWSGLEAPIKQMMRMKAPEAVKRIEALIKERQGD